MTIPWRRMAALLCCVFSFALVVFSVLRFYFGGGRGNMEGKENECFRYFTVDSNILAAFSSLVMAGFLLYGMCSSHGGLPQWVKLLHFAGVASVTVTFMTVLLFLGPKVGYGPMFEDTNLFLHAIVPILAICSVLFLGGDLQLSVWEAMIGLLPTVLYGIVYLLQVVGRRAWPDFYHFLTLGPWGIAAGMMLLGTGILSVGLYFLQKIF